jgi:PAS domain S-box-containing protein
MAKPVQTLAPDMQLFRDVFNASPIGVAVEDLEGQLFFANPAFCSMLGFSEDEMCAKHCVEFSPAEDSEKDWALFQQLRAGSIDHYQLEKRYFRRDGSTVWGRLSVSLLNGCPSPLVVAMVEDVTDKKTAEEALRNSEERFRLAAQAGKMFAFEWDVATDVVVRSGNFADVLGPTSDAPLTRQQVVARVYPDDRALFAASTAERTPENPDVQITYRMLSSDGSVVWVEKTAHAFFDEDGRMVRMIGMISAITERKQAEETLRESEEKFRSVFRDAGVGMVIVSPDGRYVAVNGTFCDYLGYTEKELVGKTVESITFAEDWPAFSQKLSVALAEGGLQRFEKRCLHKSGRIVSTESTASVIRNGDGVPQYFVGGVLDVTKRKEAEEAVSTLNRRLIEAQEQERTRIARDLHDDINQRIAMLAIDLDGLKKDPRISVPEVRTLLNGLGERLSDLGMDIQAMAHRLHSTKLEYLGIVVAMKALCVEFAEHQKVKIDFRHDNVPKALPQDISLCLFRVLQEAMSNAVKHSGVLHFEVVLAGTLDQLHLTVTDHGAGFDAQTVLSTGGLGLTSMRERVRLVNGTFAVHSKPMGGTTVHVWVPLASDHISERDAG